MRRRTFIRHTAVATTGVLFAGLMDVQGVLDASGTEVGCATVCKVGNVAANGYDTPGTILINPYWLQVDNVPNYKAKVNGTAPNNSLFQYRMCKDAASTPNATPKCTLTLHLGAATLVPGSDPPRYTVVSVKSKTIVTVSNPCPPEGVDSMILPTTETDSAAMPAGAVPRAYIQVNCNHA